MSFIYSWLDFPSGSEVICLHAGNVEDSGLIPGLGISLRGGNGDPLTIFLPGKNHMAEEPHGLESTESQRVRHNQGFTYSCIYSWQLGSCEWRLYCTVQQLHDITGNICVISIHIPEITFSSTKGKKEVMKRQIHYFKNFKNAGGHKWNWLNILSPHAIVPAITFVFIQRQLSNI